MMLSFRPAASASAYRASCAHQWRYADADFRYCLLCPQRQVRVNGEWRDEVKPHFVEREL